MTQYVVGFLFDDDAKNVLLIRKNKPRWQAGLLNGVGGKIERGESSCEAMSREFHEEAGVLISPAFWRHYAHMTGKEFTVDCFTECNSVAFISASTQTDEPLERRRVVDIETTEIITNVLWLVEMARDKNNGYPFMATIEYPT